MPVLESGAGLEVEAGRDEVQICCGHVMAFFQTPERSGAVFILRLQWIRAVRGAHLDVIPLFSRRW